MASPTDTPVGIRPQPLQARFQAKYQSSSIEDWLDTITASVETELPNAQHDSADGLGQTIRPCRTRQKHDVAPCTDRDVPAPRDPARPHTSSPKVRHRVTAAPYNTTATQPRWHQNIATMATIRGPENSSENNYASFKEYYSQKFT